jgi:hypothetical protein
MQAQERVAAQEMEQSVVETEATNMEAMPGDALLPMVLPNVGSEPAVDGADEARSDEVRGLLTAIRRLENIVEEETAALATGKKIDFDDFSARKSRSMLEFVRLMRSRMHLGTEVEVTEEIKRLREKLERNRAILEMHYDAVREVATIIVKAMKDAESDGTYTGRTTRDEK